MPAHQYHQNIHGPLFKKKSVWCLKDNNDYFFLLMLFLLGSYLTLIFLDMNYTWNHRGTRKNFIWSFETRFFHNHIKGKWLDKNEKKRKMRVTPTLVLNLLQNARVISSNQSVHTNPLTNTSKGSSLNEAKSDQPMFLKILEGIDVMPHRDVTSTWYQLRPEPNLTWKLCF